MTTYFELRPKRKMRCSRALDTKLVIRANSRFVFKTNERCRSWTLWTFRCSCVVAIFGMTEMVRKKLVEEGIENVLRTCTLRKVGAVAEF